MNYKHHEQQIARQLIAKNLSGLFELTLTLKGLVLDNQYTLCWLYAIGGQSILYLAEGPGTKQTIVKIAFLPYHRAAYISTNDIQSARRRLEREAKLLRCFQDTVFPEFYDIIHSMNPLHPPTRGRDIVNNEPFLVIEFIKGQTLLQIARKTHRGENPEYEALEWLAWEVCTIVTDFSIAISTQKDAYLYSDLNPINLIFTGKKHRPIRILDAGSLIPINSSPDIIPPFTWAYIPPEYYKAYDRENVIWPIPNYVLYTLGKTLWEILTNRQPYPGEDPDLAEPILKNYSRSLRNLLSDLVRLQYKDFPQFKRHLVAINVSREPSEAVLTSLSVDSLPSVS